MWALLFVPAIPWLAAWAGRQDQERVGQIIRALWARVLVRPWPRWRYVRVGLLTAATAGIALALARPQWGIVRREGGARGRRRRTRPRHLRLDGHRGRGAQPVLPGPGRARCARLPPRGGPHRPARLRRRGLSARPADARRGCRRPLPGDAGARHRPRPRHVGGARSGQGARHVRGQGPPQQGDDPGVRWRRPGGRGGRGRAPCEECGRRRPHRGGGNRARRTRPRPRQGRQAVSFKKDASGAAVVSHMNPQTLEAIARGTGGTFFRITPQDTSLSALAAAVEGMEQRSLSREYAYRKKERFQVPLGVALACLALALGLPVPRRRKKALAAPVVRKVVAAGVILCAASFAHADNTVKDEVLLRPRRLTSTGQRQYEQGNHPEALKSFEGAAGLRPDDPRARFNLGDALYKNGKFDQAEAIFRTLGQDARSPLAPAARYNLGNALYEKKDYPGAVQAYRDALRVAPQDTDSRRNLEIALRALQQQQQQQERQQQQQKQQQKPQSQPSPRPQPSGAPNEKRPQTEQEKEQQRFQDETGMPRERAMQLLDALQQNEKEQQKKLIAEKRQAKKGGKDW